MMTQERLSFCPSLKHWHLAYGGRLSKGHRACPSPSLYGQLLLENKKKENASNVGGLTKKQGRMPSRLA
jgi:hypothetical protein